MVPTRVKDLPGWPPQPGGPTRSGDVFPMSTDSVVIENVIGCANDHLMFTCKFRGTSVFYDFAMLDKKAANKIAAILKEHTGQPLTSIAFVEVPVDEA